MLVVVFQIQVQIAHAYLDPGTGSYLFQIIIAILLGLLFTFKMLWRKILIVFRGSKAKTGHDRGRDEGTNAE